MPENERQHAEGVAAQHCATEKTLASRNAPTCIETQQRFRAVDGPSWRPILGGMNDPSTPFARQFAALLDVSDISHKELAAQIGRSSAAISQWIHKGDMPDLSVALRLEEALEVPPGTFVKLVDPGAWAILQRRHSDGSKEAS